MELPTSMRRLHSLVTADGMLHLTVDEVPIPTPADHEVVVRVEAAPINPSDLGLLLATADLDGLSAGGGAGPSASAPVPTEAMAGLQARVGIPMAVGNEGAGVVIAAGSAPEAQALVGRTVGMVGGEMYAEYRCLPAASCLPMPDGVTAEQAASPFVNPMTVLAMLETMRREGHRAIVHTAAASNLGQMLSRACASDGVALVNVVRRPAQAELLRSIGAEHVVDSSAPSFLDDLTAAISATGATLAFDAIGGGPQAAQILGCMERALTAGQPYSRYGSPVHKQVYTYGSLDRGPTVINRGFGMAWGVGGWLLTPRLMQFGGEVLAAFRERVAAEITTTFASSYTDRVSLVGALGLDAIRSYARQATGQKFLIQPHA